MADNLPLIPNKRGGCVGDVRPVLRAVFRERASQLPPLPPAAPLNRAPTRRGCPCACDCDTAAQTALHEAALREERARRLARAPSPAAYALREPLDPALPPDHCKLLQRSDLMPRLDQNATRNTTLWVKNILNRSSSGASTLRVSTSPQRSPPSQWSPSGSVTSLSECRSAQSLSIGEVVVREPPPPLPQPPPTPLPEYIISVPTSLNFVNFTPGQCHTHSLRLVNMSARETALSVRPLQRRELDLQLCGRLHVTSGAATEMLVHFLPTDVRAIYDELLVRVEGGKPIHIPISCYIQPPILDVLMPNMDLSMQSCVLEGTTYVPPESEQASAAGAVGAGDAQVLDLGARLLGDVHYSRLVLRCVLDHVKFFLVTESAWLFQNILEVCLEGALVAGAFVVTPVTWRGGGEVHGAAWCNAARVGLHSATLRVLCTTAITRPLHLIADAIYFYPEHVTLQAQEKTYDICSDSDPDCEYYVNLGTTFQNHGLASSVLIINHSPLTYSYYWCVREWGKCQCWQEEMLANTWLGAEDDPERLCPGARVVRADMDVSGSGEVINPVDTNDANDVKDSNATHVKDENAKDADDADVASEADDAEEGSDAVMEQLRLEKASGVIAPRSSVPLHVAVPDVGKRLGTHRAVLVLVLKDIPQKSFPPGFYPMVVTKSTILTPHIPGVKREERTVCEVVCCQLEVWWHVTPVRFVLDPPLITLPYSRRVQSVELQIRATQLFGGGAAQAAWRMSQPGGALPAATELRAARPQLYTVTLPLPELPNHFPVTETITLEEERGRWVARALVSRRCETRHPALRPHAAWLGVVPPAAQLRTTLTLTNDTYQDIYWWADVERWLHERWPKDVCMSRPAPCKKCLEKRCTCRILRPSRGFLARHQSIILEYSAMAPDEDGCVATLVRVRRTEADTARLAREPPATARTALIAYRVLAPRLTLTVHACGGESHECGLACALDAAEGAVLRPARALTVGLRTCYRLHLTNHTPIATRIKWEPPPDGENILKTIFIPEEFDMTAYEETDIRVVLEARRVCARRVWARRAHVQHAPEHIYLLIDAAISGLEVDYWLPLPEFSLCLRRKQRETFPWSKTLPTTTEEAFAWEDAKREVITRNICHCKQELRWVEPPTPPPRPPGVATPPPEIVTTPPPLTRTCSCWLRARLPRPPDGPIALEVRALPLNTVRSLRVRLRSACALAARWSACARLGALTPPRTLHTGGAAAAWAARVRTAGVGVVVAPARGVLGARAAADVELRVYADSWGVYRDQILILVEGLEPLVLNLWVEAVGCPLQFALRPRIGDDQYSDSPPVLWVTQQDPEHTVRARNTSRGPLLLHAYLLREHEHAQDAYPFRLCIRLFSVLPPTCPCLFTYDQSTVSVSDDEDIVDAASVTTNSMDTGIELYLAPDYGIQDTTIYEVEPVEQEVAAGGTAEWHVRPRAPARELPHPPHTLLLRIQPLKPRGPWWFRGEPAPASVRLRSLAPAALLQVSHESVVARLCALELPYNELLRVRKRLRVQNVGNGTMTITVRITEQTDDEDVAGASVVFVMEAPTEELGEMSEDLQNEIAEKRTEIIKRKLEKIDVGNVSQAGDIFKVDDVYDTPAASSARAGPEWRLVEGARRGACAVGCAPRAPATRLEELQLTLPPHSTTELCVEVSVRSEEVCPARWGGVGGEDDEQLPARYDEHKTFTTLLQFRNNDDVVIKTVPLVLELELPRVVARPSALELGYVCDGDTRKTYFAVSHTSRKETISVHVSWLGGVEFRMNPTHLVLPPGVEQNVYVIYTARYTGAVSEGWAEVRAAGAAGAWCCAAVRVRARASRDYKCHLPPHDHTDERSLLPPDLCLP